MDDEALMKLLRKNSDKNFVRRILNPEAFPFLEKNGTRMSHFDGIRRSRWSLLCVSADCL